MLRGSKKDTSTIRIPLQAKLGLILLMVAAAVLLPMLAAETAGADFTPRGCLLAPLSVCSGELPLTGASPGD